MRRVRLLQLAMKGLAAAFREASHIPLCQQNITEMTAIRPKQKTQGQIDEYRRTVYQLRGRTHGHRRPPTALWMLCCWEWTSISHMVASYRFCARFLRSKLSRSYRHENHSRAAVIATSPTRIYSTEFSMGMWSRSSHSSPGVCHRESGSKRQ